MRNSNLGRSGEVFSHLIGTQTHDQRCTSGA
uniref:Uncharacterized protein n=1 Tax=Anguilla anguilla TaxID=7936 RepID=A0A0E9UXE0_ANGAN